MSEASDMLAKALEPLIPTLDKGAIEKAVARYVAEGVLQRMNDDLTTGFIAEQISRLENVISSFADEFERLTEALRPVFEVRTVFRNRQRRKRYGRKGKRGHRDPTARRRRRR